MTPKRSRRRCAVFNFDSKETPAMNETPCAGCGRPIVFAHLIENEKPDAKVPLDLKPPCYSLEEIPGAMPVARRARAVHVSHFATCPKASAFSGDKAPAPIGRELLKEVASRVAKCGTATESPTVAEAAELVAWLRSDWFPRVIAARTAAKS
jgi:hypothetical protein